VKRLREMHGAIDRVARRVMRSGIHYERERHESEKHWKEPRPTYKFIPQLGNPQSVDLTGRKFGRFTVVGYLGSKEGASAGAGKNRKGSWLVRCVCGSYEPRTARAIRSPENNSDCCLDCRKLEQLKGLRGDDWRHRPK
jgi:hypothetical protein